LLDMGMEAKIVEKSGAWLSYGDLRIGQGRENAKQFLRDNPELADEIEMKLRRHLGLLPPEPIDKTIPTDPSRAKEKARRSTVDPRDAGTFPVILAFGVRMSLALGARLVAGAFLLFVAGLARAEIRVAAERTDHRCPAGAILGVVSLDRAEPPSD